MAQLRAQYGLDKPLPVQLGVYLGKVVQGDLGYSYFFNLPVTRVIVERVPATLLLVLSSVLLRLRRLGTTLGVLSSREPNGMLSQFITVLSLVGFAAPVFWIGIMLVILFASVLADPAGVGHALDRLDGQPASSDVLDVLHHLVLPAVTLACVPRAVQPAGARVDARRAGLRTSSVPRAPRALPSAWCSTSMRCATRCCRW